MTETRLTARSTRTRTILLAGVVPIAIAVVALALMLSWLPELPDPIAVHWSGAGPDGFGPAVPFLVMPPALTGVFAIFAVVISWRLTPSGRLTWNQKFIVVTGLWLAALLNIGIGGSVAGQRGLDDARDAPDVVLSLAIGAAVGLVLACAAWFLLPPAETIDEAGGAPRRVEVEGDERVVWSRAARLGNVALAFILVVLVVVVVVVTFVLVSSGGFVWFPVIVLVFIAALVATNTWWRVSADRRGLLVRGVLGWPRKLIVLDDIRSVQVVDVHPSRDYGGWGWRWGGNGRSGIILRAGEAIEVTQSNGKRFVVTVDDAGTGAGVLSALLAQRAR